MSNEALETQRQALVAELQETIAKYKRRLANPPKYAGVPSAKSELIAGLEEEIPKLEAMLANWGAKKFDGGKTRRRRGSKGRTRRTR